MFGANKKKYEIALNGWAQEIVSLDPFLRLARIDYIREQLCGAWTAGVDSNTETSEVIDDLIKKIDSLVEQEPIDFLSPSYPPAHMAHPIAKWRVRSTVKFINEAGVNLLENAEDAYLAED